MPEMLDTAKQIGEYASAHPRDTSALLNWFAPIELAKNEDKAAAYSQNELFRYYASNALKSDIVSPGDGAKTYDVDNELPRKRWLFYFCEIFENNMCG